MRSSLLTTAILVIAQVVGACAARAAPVTLNGEVQYETFGYPDSESQHPGWENFFAGTVRGNGRLASTLTFQFEGRAVADDLQFTQGAYSLRNAGARRPYLSLISGVLDYRPSERLRISVGKQLVSWSGFDELQPANLMTPRDESDIFRRVESGVPGVSIHYGTGDLFADLVVVPLAFTPSRLPQGRWDIVRTIASGSIEQRQELPPVRLDETQAGARVGARLGQLEASVFGYVGRDTSAVFVTNSIYVGLPQLYKVEVVSQYPRINAGGVTASHPLGERILLRVESVYFNSPDRVHDDFLQIAGGLEYALDDWRLVISYLRDDTVIRAPRDDTVIRVDRGERRFFQSFVFGELRYDAGSRLQGRLRGGYDATGEFWLLQPEISYRLWRGLRVALLGEVIDSNRVAYEDNFNSYFDSVRHEDRLGTRLEYHF